jgi:hypothetical protein
VEKSHELGFNLSKKFENYLKHFLTQFSSTDLLNKGENGTNPGVWWAGPDSNPNEVKSTIPQTRAYASHP